MALDRNIYWVGRQWAVTGIGLQAIDQRLKGAFDIEIDRLWDDDLRQRIGAHAWINMDDFDKALAVAQARFPEPQRKPLPLIESVLELIQQPTPVDETPPSEPALDMTTRLSEVFAIEQPKQPALPPLAWRIERASARFMPQWRVRR
ncbi:hypothetical protein [Bradyrhizobium sp.]|uniref:hypothetical protein n=1 Tax=Bradyrhizobium sp. TaxID=376 RepID=UPI003C31F272